MSNDSTQAVSSRGAAVSAARGHAAPGALAAGVIRVPVRGQPDMRLTGNKTGLLDGRGTTDLPGAGDAGIDQPEAAGAREPGRSTAVRCTRWG